MYEILFKFARKFGKLMRKTYILSILLILVSALSAQTPRDDIRKNVRCSASNYFAYPGPTQHRLTPPPAGMKPFYISHYGRHGSRYHNRPSIYDAPWKVLAHADSLGKLTPLGHDVTERLDRIRHDAENHWGELTTLGAEQHQQIITRMYERFPEVFADSADIHARSTTVVRCIMSMEYALQRLTVLNPRLRIHHHATHRDMDHLNQQDRRLFSMKMDSTSKRLYQAFAHKYQDCERLMTTLFSDTAYLHHEVDANDLNLWLFKVACNIQSTDLRRDVTLYDLYTDDELFRYWRMDNAWWYVAFAGCTVNGSQQPYTQRNLLRHLISEAERHIAMPGPSAQLRYGHETVVLPLACLLDINGYGLETDDLESLDKRGWANYRIFPMASNIQLIFYRSDGSQQQKKKGKQTDRKPTAGDAGEEILLKVLLNENEATLPLKAVEGPYYRWSDFKDYYLEKLDRYEQHLSNHEKK